MTICCDECTNRPECLEKGRCAFGIKPLPITTVPPLDNNPTFAVSSYMVHTIKLPEYNCPIHGVVNNIVTFYETGKPNEYYCMECYKDMIRKFCQPVTPV